MSRILKFRAWDTDLEMWLALTGFETEETKVSKNYGYTLGGMFHDGDYVGSDGIEVMQYTGLKDKNGSEIYEGDIVKARDVRADGLNKFYICEIVWMPTGWYAMRCKDTIWENNYLNINILETEILGNKYENPELLKEVEKC